MYSVLPCNPPIGQILVLVPRFDRELSKHSSAAKMAPGLNSSLFSTKACITNNEHNYPSWHMVSQVSVCLSFKRILVRFSKFDFKIFSTFPSFPIT